jgi:hypothetical protein
MEAEVGEVGKRLVERDGEVKRAEGRVEEAEGRVRVAEARVKEVEGKAREVEEGIKGRVEKEVKARVEKEVKARVEKEVKERVEKQVTGLRKAVEEKEEERKAAQSELDDLLEVFGDFEEKINKYKVSTPWGGGCMLVLWRWCGANDESRNGSRRWGRRCLMERTTTTTMKTTTMRTTTKTRKTKRNRGFGEEVEACTRALALGLTLGLFGSEKQARLVMCIFSGYMNITTGDLDECGTQEGLLGGCCKPSAPSALQAGSGVRLR